MANTTQKFTPKELRQMPHNTLVDVALKLQDALEEACREFDIADGAADFWKDTAEELGYMDNE